MSKTFPCIKETIILAVIKREIVNSVMSYDGVFIIQVQPDISNSNRVYVSVNGVKTARQLREMIKILTAVADVLEENSKETPVATPDADGWIPWVATKNSKCPVNGDVLVQIKTVNYPHGQSRFNAYKAKSYIWNNCTNNIIAYRVVKPL